MIINKFRFLVTVLAVLAVLGSLLAVAYVLNEEHNQTQNEHRLLHQLGELSHANQQRIADIQRSRLEGCKRTYESFREVFQPLVPKHPSPQQRANLAKFNSTIDRLERNCKVAIKREVR